MNEYRNRPTIEQLIEWFGVQRAAEICIAVGGSRLRVSRGAGMNHFFAPDEISRFQETWDGLYIRFPLALNFTISYLSEVEGLSHGKIARVLHCHEETVRRNLKSPSFQFSKDGTLINSMPEKEARHV